MIPEYALTFNHIEDYIIEVDIPILSFETKTELLSIANSSIQYKTWIFKDYTNCFVIDKPLKLSLSVGDVSLDSDKFKIIKLLRNNGISLDFEDIVFEFDRVNKTTAIYSDSYRKLTLFTLLDHERLIKFYSVLDYSNKKKNMKINFEKEILLETDKWYLINDIALHELSVLQESIALCMNLYCRFYDYKDASKNWKRLLVKNDTI